MVRHVLQWVLEAVLCWLALLALVWVLADLSIEAIPPEPEDQLSESVGEGWGDPRSSQWSRVRNHHIEIHPSCEACGSQADLNVHHILPFYLRPELELDPANLITLCREHHFRVGHDPDGPWKPLKPSWKSFNPRVWEHCQQIKQGK